MDQVLVEIQGFLSNLDGSDMVLLQDPGVWYNDPMEDQTTDPSMDDFEFTVPFPKHDGPPCPTCDEPTVSIDGEYICFDCNGGMYGPGMG